VDFDTFLKKVGAQVRRARWAAGLSQEDTSAEVLTFRLLGQLERGNGNPTLRTLFLLARKLDVAVAELVAVESDRATKSPLKSRALRPPKPGRKPAKKRIPVKERRRK
jgi:transcriptional regulator with XRE-family HTH domain